MNTVVLKFPDQQERSQSTPLTNQRSPKDVIWQAIVRIQASLTVEAFSVANHLLNCAEPEMLRDSLVWVTRRGQKSIAENCFRTSYPNSSDEVLRRKVFQSINELVDRGIIIQENHIPSETLCNTYLFTPPGTWRSPTLTHNPLVRKGRRRSTVDPPEIYPDPPEREDLARSSQDQDQNIYIDPVLDRIGSRERERFKERQTDFSFSTAENPPDRSPQSGYGSQWQVPAGRSETPATTGVDPFSAPALSPISENPQPRILDKHTYEGFDFKAFRPSDHREYYEWALRGVELERDRREQIGHANRIIDPARFTLRCIELGEARKFKEYLQAIGELPPDAPPPSTPLPPSHSPQTRSQKPTARSQQDLEREQWRQASETLNRLYKESRFDDLQDRLRRCLSGAQGCPPNPEKVRWILSQNPHWQIELLQDGRLVSAKQDLSDLILSLKAKFQMLGFDRDRRNAFLRQHYSAAIDTMSEVQLRDCLNRLSVEGEKLHD